MKVDILASNLKQEDPASLFKPIKVWILIGPQVKILNLVLNAQLRTLHFVAIKLLQMRILGM